MALGLAPPPPQPSKGEGRVEPRPPEACADPFAGDLCELDQRYLYQMVRPGDKSPSKGRAFPGSQPLRLQGVSLRSPHLKRESGIRLIPSPAVWLVGEGLRAAWAGAHAPHIITIIIATSSPPACLLRVCVCVRVSSWVHACVLCLRVMCACAVWLLLMLSECE